MIVLLALCSLAQPPADLAARAIADNPTVQGLRARQQALQASMRGTGLWSDPMVSVELSNAPIDSFDPSDHPMAGIQFRVQQRFELPGHTRAARAVVSGRAAEAGYAIAEAEVDLRAQIEVAYYRLALSQLHRGLTEQHIARTDELIGAVRSLYEVGKTGQHALLRLGVLKRRLQDDLGEFSRIEAELRAALARAVSADGPLDLDLPTELAALAPPAGTDAWLEAAEANNPSLARIREQALTARAEADRASVDGRPDVTGWVGYRVRTIQTATDPGTDMVTAGVSVPIPIGQTQRARSLRASWLDQAAAAEHSLAAALDDLRERLALAHARWVRAAEKATTYREVLLPQAASTLETTLADYRVDKADFASLYAAEVTLLELERAVLAAETETWLQRAMARAAVGADLPGVLP